MWVLIPSWCKTSRHQNTASVCTSGNGLASGYESLPARVGCTDHGCNDMWVCAGLIGAYVWTWSAHRIYQSEDWRGREDLIVSWSGLDCGPSIKISRKEKKLKGQSANEKRIGLTDFQNLLFGPLPSCFQVLEEQWDRKMLNKINNAIISLQA